MAGTRRSFDQPNAQPVQNPWGLTCAEVDVMDTLCQLGTAKAVAERLKLSHFTVNDQMKEAYRKIGVHCRVRACLLWDRWRQKEGKDVPA